MKVLLMAVISLHLQTEAVLPKELEVPKPIEYKDGRAKRRDRRKGLK